MCDDGWVCWMESNCPKLIYAQGKGLRNRFGKGFQSKVRASNFADRWWFQLLGCYTAGEPAKSTSPVSHAGFPPCMHARTWRIYRIITHCSHSCWLLGFMPRSSPGSMQRKHHKPVRRRRNERTESSLARVPGTTGSITQSTCHARPLGSSVHRGTRATRGKVDARRSVT